MVTTEIDNAVQLVSPLFQRCFRGDSAPDRGRHFVTMVPIANAWQLLSYVHFQPFGDTCLGGGACTDVEVLRLLSAEQRNQLRAADGPYLTTLRYALAKMRKDFFAVFGHTSDRRAEMLDLRAGFRHTGVEHLLIYTPESLDPVLERALVAKIASIGAF